jgi:hypothetical protein
MLFSIFHLSPRGRLIFKDVPFSDWTIQKISSFILVPYTISQNFKSSTAYKRRSIKNMCLWIINILSLITNPFDRESETWNLRSILIMEFIFCRSLFRSMSRDNSLSRFFRIFWKFAKNSKAPNGNRVWSTILSFQCSLKKVSKNDYKS